MNCNTQMLQVLRHKLAGHKPVRITDSYREAAVLVGLIPVENELGVVLTKRAQHLNLHPGEAAFPGGKKDPGDTSLLTTALREANEEVGLAADKFELLGELDQQVTRSDFKVSPFVGVICDSQLLVANRNELDSVYTVPLSYFLKTDHLEIVPVEYQGQTHNSARFNYQQHIIWGMTARVIVNLVNTVFDAGIHLDKIKRTQRY